MAIDLTPEHTARHQSDDKELHPEVQAAYRYVESVLDSADVPSGKLGGPLWFGWALREAFLAGCSHASAPKPGTPQPTTMGGFLATKEAVEEYLHDTSAQSESMERPVWTEGVCGDGAAILKDGVMQPIEDVIAALNAAEVAQPEPVGPTNEGEWYPGFADWLEREMPEGTVIGDPLWWSSKIADYLARFCRPAITPIPVSERPWEQEGFCDANGCCWWFHRETFGRNACWCYSRGSGVEAFCLPHWALPISAAPETA